MARLPIPGSDDNTWGNILNEYLTTSLNNDGTIKASALPGATSSSLGSVQLTGDLSGTATSPTVPGLAAKANDNAVLHNTGNESVAGTKTFASAPIVPIPTSPTETANKAYVDSVAGSGSTPDADAVTKGKIQLANDISGTAAAPTVVATHLSSALPVAQGGTGSTTQNFVDLSTGQTVAGVKTFSAAPIVPTPTNSTEVTNKSYVDTAISTNATPDANASTKGKVQLANDFGGTAAAPTVVATHLSSALPVAQGGTGSTTQNFVDLSTGQTVAGVKAFSSSPTVPTPTNNTDAANKSYVDGVAGSGSTPDADAVTKGKVQLANDFGGTAAAPTVVATHLSSALPIAQGGTGSTTKNFVDLTTSQSIAGVKTFSAAPIVPTPTNSTEAANKAYVDSVGGGGGNTDAIVFSIALG